MWKCPICLEEQSSEYLCENCGFDRRRDFVDHRTVCEVFEEDIAIRRKCAESCKIRVIENSEGRYEGECKNGMKHGHGIFYWPDGTVYDGEWQDGRKEGLGTLHFSEAAIIPADGRTIKKKDMVSIAGLAAPVTKAASKTVRWMGGEYYIIMKVPGTSANLKMV